MLELNLENKQNVDFCCYVLLGTVLYYKSISEPKIRQFVWIVVNYREYH